MSGGDEPPVIKGEDSYFCAHTEEEANQIKDLLKNTVFTTNEIANLYNYQNRGSIIRINNGVMWFDEALCYPLRDFSNSERALEIIYLLKTTLLKQKDIAILVGVKRSTVTMINSGLNHKIEGVDYPIRKQAIK